MRIPDFPLPRNAREGIAWQRELAGQVRQESLPTDIRWIAGTDVAFNKNTGLTHAAVVVVDAATLQLREVAGATILTTFPYIPGLLSFREIPALLACFNRLLTVPDVILCDGQGIAHPRGLGLASHLGLVLDIPTVGCAKSRLVGEHANPPPERGGRTPLMHRDRPVGAVLRTRAGVKPLFISVGHLVTLDDAVGLVLACARRYRLPEPQRLAHHHAALEKQTPHKGTENTEGTKTGRGQGEGIDENEASNHV
jgi:deoxyribonuclease V